MNEIVEALLVAWGDEVADPALDVSIRSPLGALGDEGGSARAGSRCLMTGVEFGVVMSAASCLVQQALDGLAEDEPAGLAALGRVLRRLACVRYAQRQKLAVREQCRLLAISERTYRERVRDLHISLEGALQGLLRGGALAAALGPVELSARKRLERGRQAERRQAQKKRRMMVQRRVASRALAIAALAADE
ncbi:hypothetical protein [Pseudomonas sp. LRF_L74]|uniref:hypothetical protein n=1 Tax=Pseudomonas sp. LRF_L74 TaxID=3369422 RepID=UPI003F610FFB